MMLAISRLACFLWPGSGAQLKGLSFYLDILEHDGHSLVAGCEGYVVILTVGGDN